MQSTKPAARSTAFGDLRRLLAPSVFRALGDPCRAGLLASLAEACRPLTVSELAASCPVDLSVVSRHLAALRDAGVLTSRKEGRQVLYEVRYRQLASKLRQLADAIDACCPDEPAPGAKEAPATTAG